MEIDAFRFWIGSSDERSSSVWKIWERNRQVYATAASFGGSIKLSIHSPAYNQFGFTSEYRKRENLDPKLNGRNSFVRWKRKRPMEGEVVPAAFIQFPTDFLQSRKTLPKFKQKKFRGFLEAAAPGRCVELAFFIVQYPNQLEPLSMNGPYVNLLQMPMGENETCLVGARHTEFDSGFIPKPITSRMTWLSDDANRLSTGETLQNLSSTLWSHPKDFEAIRIAEISGVNITKNV
ncbi:hypothetical protein [Defluviimonas sp. SAOS-178_SWC]|uniref:hypothetical protein n=1 Tax=Defluviimonas sp. SAOS-178_SWC TaxID=3121287 RepID=UPI003221D55F